MSFPLDEIPGEFNLNTVLIVIGWVVGGLVVVIGMRKQMEHLASEIALLRQTLVVITGRIDKNEADVSYLRGLEDGRRQHRVGG